jgi:uncharacterized membrane protein YkvA (DUF1232 family)
MSKAKDLTLLRVNYVKDLSENNKLLDRWKERAAQLKQEVHALALACKDPRVPWYAKVLAICIVAYALSPIDLIPDFIPVLGYLDDLILVPLGIFLVLKMMPDELMAECRERARAFADKKRTANWFAVGVIVAVWIALSLTAIWLLTRFL